MKDWLEGIVTAILRVQSSEKQFVTATCVACCLKQCKITFSLKKREFLIPLLQMLQIQPVSESRTCPKYTYLCDLLVKASFRYECMYVY